MRATTFEIEELISGDPHWWGDTLGCVASDGLLALRNEAESRGWAWSSVWAWVVGDEGRKRELDAALEAKAQLLGWGTEGIAGGATSENVAVAKLQVETAFRLAGKVDRARWGEKVDHIGLVLDPLSEMLREISERRLAAMRAPAERVIEAIPVPDIVDEI